MADFVFNITKGAVAEMARLAANKFLVLLLKASIADATQKDFDTVSALLADAGVDEADFTNYARKTALTATITVDDVNDRVDLDLPDQTWTAAGGAANNTLVDLVVAYEDAAADATRRPCTQHDFAVTTDGTDLTAVFNAAGFLRAA